MFAIWFASGMVMVFAGFPSLDDARRLAALPRLAIDPAVPSPARALAHTPVRGRVRLGVLAGRPVYRFSDGDRTAGIVNALAGRDVATADPTSLISLAQPYFESADARWTTTIVSVRDQWNVTSPAGAQFPLIRFTAADRAHTEVYISSKTAEVVQVTTRRARLLAWAGAIPHWIYPVALRRHAAAWRWLVLGIAALGAVGSLSGLLLGVWMWRGGSPYRTRWMRWHHILGLLFGVFVFTWVGSGAWSLEPFRVGARAAAGRSVLLDDVIEPDQLSRFAVEPAYALALCRRDIEPRELELVQMGGRPHYLCRQSPDETRLVVADRPTVAVTRTPAVASATPAAEALDRWIFRGLHCLDFGFLPSRSRAWYTVVLALSAGGLIFSLTGVVVAAGWLSRVRRHDRR
jgi:PepSY-associated transmembrane protein